MVPVASSVTVAGTFAAAPAARRVKLAVVIVAAAMGLLNVAVTVVVGSTTAAVGAGAWAFTFGAVSVVKLHTESAPSVVPATSVTVPDSVAVYAVHRAIRSFPTRRSSDLVASSVTVAGTFAAAPAARRVKVAVVIVAAFTGLLNVAVTVLVRGTPVAPFGGAWTVTVGAVSVVKLQITAAASVVQIVRASCGATVA